MEHNERLLVIDFDKLETNKGGVLNINEEISLRSAIMNPRDPITNDNYNFRMDRFKALKALQRHVFRQEISLFFDLINQSDDYTDSNQYYGPITRYRKRRGRPSCITGSQSLQLVLNLQEE